MRAQGIRCAAFGVGTGSNDLAAAMAQVRNKAALDELDSFRGLPDNWDAQGAAASQPDSLDAAKTFLSYEISSTSWDASLHADGRMILQSESHGSYVELTFGPANHVTVVSKLPGGEPTVRILEFESLLSAAPQATAA